ncbi:MAG: HD domain-containing protein [Desulfuromonadales bacterium]|nr:HD domain-containing protein [Desulfuromonadales bacterium]
MPDQELYNTRLLDPFIKLIARRYPQVEISEIYTYAQIMPWEAADHAHWLSQEQVNRFVEKAVELTGNPALAREAGQYGASPESFGAMRSYVLSFVSPHIMFERIGEVISRLLRSSTYTPEWIAPSAIAISVVPKPGVKEELYQCENRVGVFEAVLQSFHYKYPAIEHPECLFKGGNRCLYVIRWEITAAARFRRARHGILIISPLLGLLPAIGFPQLLLVAVPALASLYFLCGWLEATDNLKETKAGLEHLTNSRDQLMELVDSNYNNAQMTNEIGQVISRQTTVDTILDALIKVLEKRLDFDRGMVLLANKEKTCLNFRAGFGHHEQEMNLLSKATFRLDNARSRGVFIKAFHEQVPYLVDDFEEFERRHTPHSVQLAKALGVKSFVCCPIICDGESIGVLAVDNLRTSRPLMQSDKSLLMGIAPVIGVSIRNAELLLSKEKEFRSTLQVLAASIDARDPLTAGHSEKVTEYSVGICDELNMGSDFRECVRVAALLHDYGKIGVPDSILKKVGRLSTEEYEVIKTHTAQTRDILERINFEGKYADVPLIAGSHHEKWNGNGYPLGLKGEEIHIGARIIAVADHFEAITSKRHYRDPMPVVVAIDELLKYSGSYFDPQVVKAFVRYYRRCYNGTRGGEDGSGGVCRIRHKRVPVEAPVMVQTRAHTLSGKTCDISLNGIYISIPEELGQGLTVKIELMLPGRERPIVASGRIAWVNSGGNPTKPHYPAGCGVELTNFDEEGDALLNNYIRLHPQEGELH